MICLIKFIILFVILYLLNSVLIFNQLHVCVAHSTVDILSPHIINGNKCMKNEYGIEQNGVELLLQLLLHRHHFGGGGSRHSRRRENSEQFHYYYSREAERILAIAVDEEP